MTIPRPTPRLAFATDRPSPVPVIRCAVAVAAAVYAVMLLQTGPFVAAGQPTDFDHLWFAARVMLAGGDPYAAVGPGRAFDWPWRLFYPGTALALVAPLTLVSAAAARALFVGVSAGLLAYAITRDGWWRLPLLLSAPFVNASEAAQWSPLIASALFLPALGLLVGAKPTVGIAILATAPSARRQLTAIGSAFVLLLVSLALRPSWPWEWLATIAAADHLSAPITHWTVGGPLVLLALSRWRRPEARMMLALACVPQSTVLYEGLYLLLVPASFAGVMIFTAWSWGLFAAQSYIASTATSTVGLQHAAGDVLVLGLYLPALVLLLRRPNDGAVPGWMEWGMARLRRA